MTKINLDFARPGADGSQLPVKGTLTWTPTMRHTVDGPVDTVVLPLGFKVPVTADPFQITVAPNGTGWVWKVEEVFSGLRTRRIYVTVPDVTEVNYADLVLVDPKTLLPSAAPVPAWYGYVDSVEASAAAAAAAAETARAAAAAVGTASVKVVTGNEVRPDAALVFWIGGGIQPVNMGANDLWFVESANLVDTIKPSTPAGLAATDITANGFTLTWAAATDNSGVVGYDIFLNTVLKASTSGATTAVIAGLTSSTQYSVTVTAYDAAGNVSDASTALSVTTGAQAGSPRHSIWGTNPYPYSSTKATESNTITVANSFYSYGTSPDVSAWRVVGAKIWVPAGVTLTNPATVSVWFGASTMIDATPNSSATITNWVSGAWNEVTFPQVVETNSGESVWIGYTFGNGDYLYTPEAEIGSSFVVASDGSHIVLSDNNGTTQLRSQFRSGTGAPTYAAPNGYSIDVIYDEGPLA